MSYGELKIDTITFTAGGVDSSVSVSGLVQNPTFTGNLTTTGTISGDIIRGNTISGVTITGDTGNFTSGIFSTGTAAEPTIIFDGDPDTGFFSSVISGTTTQHVSYALSGVETLRLTNGAGDNRIQLNNFTSRVSEQVLIEDTGSTRVTIVGNNANGAEEGGAYLGLARAGAGSLNSFTSLASGNVMGKVEFRAANGVGNLFVGASIEARADRNTGSTSTPGNLAFYTTASGSTTPTERMHINSSGNVGIGTALPDRNLEVVDTSSALTFPLAVSNLTDAATDVGAAIDFRLTTGGNTRGNVGCRWTSNDAADGTYLFFSPNDGSTGNVEAMRLTGTGRLLHGTTESVTANGEIRNVQIVTDVNNANNSLGIYNFTAGNNAPRLDLGSSPNGTINDFTTVSSDGSLCGRINFLGSDGDEFLPTARIEGRVDGTAGNGDMPGRLMFLTTEDGTASPTERMRINNAGNVLIGTTVNINERLGIRAGGGGIQITRNNSGSPSSGDTLGSLGFKGVSSTNSNTAAEASIVAVAAANHSGTSAGTNLLFNTKNTTVGPGSAPAERMRITADGRVSIGNTTPENTWKFQVQDASLTALLSVTSNVASPMYGGVIVYRHTKAANEGTGIAFNLNDSGDARSEYCYIGGVIEDNTATSEDGSLIIAPQVAGVRTEKVRITGAPRILMGTTTELSSSLGIQMYTSSPYFLGCRADNNPTSGTVLTGLYGFSQSGSTFAESAYVRIEAGSNVTSGQHYGRIRFGTTFSGTSSTSVGQFDRYGGLYVGPDGDYGTGNYAQTSGSGNFYYRRDDGSTAGTLVLANNADRGWSLAYFNKFAWNSGDDNRFIAWYVNGSSVATISYTGSAISYGTTSDYRLKTNASTYANGLEKVKQLHVREFDWINNPDADRTVGFFAHELQEIFPQAVMGVKDKMKIDEQTGEEVPEYQEIDYGKITPLLAAALQEAIDKIETLEAKVAALESA